MANTNNILERISEEVDANTKILNAEIPGGLTVEARIACIAKSPKAAKAQARNELLLTKKLELEALLGDFAIKLGSKEA